MGHRVSGTPRWPAKYWKTRGATGRAGRGVRPPPRAVDGKGAEPVRWPDARDVWEARCRRLQRRRRYWGIALAVLITLLLVVAAWREWGG